MGFIIFILIVIAFIWGIKKSNEDPEESKTNLLAQIKQINSRLSNLENELKSIKGLEKIPQYKQEAETEPDAAETNTFDYVIADGETVTAEQSSEHSEEIPKPEVIYSKDQKEEKIETRESVKADEKSELFEGVLEKLSDKNEFESYVAGNLFNKIGALALIIGMAFFLKYAFDNNWISPVVQIITGFVVAISLLIGANHFNKNEKYKVFAQGIAGAGIAISYLTIYSAYSFYQLFSYPIAFFLMLITTVISFSQALKYDSVATALLGLTGGFLTPFIISNGASNPLGLLTYLAFLNVLVVSFLHKKESWKLLGIISALTTYITYFSVHMVSYNSPNQIISIIFLTIIWALYFIFDVIKIKNSTYDYELLNIANGILFYCGVYNLYSNETTSIVISTFLIALIYLFSGIIVHYKHNGLDAYLKQNFYAFIVLSAIATNIATTGFMKPALFAVEAFMLLYFGTKLEKSYIQKSSTAFYTISCFTLLCNPQTYSFGSMADFIPIFNLRALAFIILVGLCALSVKVLEKAENTDWLKSLYRYSYCTLLFIFLSLEINDLITKIMFSTGAYSSELISFNKAMVQVLVWIAYSIKLLSSGLEKSIKPFIHIGFIGLIIALFALLPQGANFVPIENFIPVLNLRFVAFVLTAVSLYYLCALLKKHQDDYSWSSTVQNTLTYAWCSLLFILLNCEINDYFTKNIIADAFNKYMIFGIAWSLFSVPLIKKGLDKMNLPLIVCGFSVLAFALTLSVFSGVMPFNSFVLLFNLRFLMFVVLIIVLVLVYGWLNKNMSNHPQILLYLKILQVISSLLLLYLFSIEIIDYYEQSSYYGTTSGTQHLVMSMTWLIYSLSLMVFGILKRMRAIRYVALIIIGITIFKVFILDLSFLDQLSRIVSFIILGLMMLVFSFFYQKYSEQIKKLIHDDIQISDNKIRGENVF